MPKPHEIPTHYEHPDRIEIMFFGITIGCTFRQGMIYLLGGYLVLELWKSLVWLESVLFLRWMSCLLLALFMIIWATFTWQGRTLDDWCQVWLQSCLRPQIYLWHDERKEEQKTR